MKAQAASKEAQSFYALERRDDIALLKLGDNFLFESIDLSVGNRLFDAIDQISKSDC